MQYFSNGKSADSSRSGDDDRTHKQVSVMIITVSMFFLHNATQRKMLLMTLCYLYFFQVIKMLVAIAVLFAICHGPSSIDNVLVSFGYVDQLHYRKLKYMRQAFALISYFNSCINPIVYAFMSKTFRESFKYALCMCSSRSELYHKGQLAGYSPAVSNADNFTISTSPTTRPSPYPSPVPKVKGINSNCLLITEPASNAPAPNRQDNNRFLKPQGHFL